MGWQREPYRDLDRRPFVGWDGEGVTHDGDVAQSYVLFGCSEGDRIDGWSLSTVDCLDLLLEVESRVPNAIHVGFGFGYDVNMILRDVPYELLARLYRTNHVQWEGYRLDWLPGKWFNVKRGKTTCRVFESFGFFQSSFLIACEKFLGKDDPLLTTIQEGKAARRTFRFDELESLIVPYWRTELELFVRLMNTLRDDLEGAGFTLHSWHGPGAVANTVLKSRGMAEHMQEPPELVNRASQFAYAGGRFELFRCGHHPGKVWQYDLNSAYPAAATTLPSLDGATWEHVTTFEPGSFGVWNIEHIGVGDPDALMLAPWPLFCRDRHGNVSFPPMVAGWVWTPEAELVPESVRHGWVLRHDGVLPFRWVREMYAQRKAWKAEGNSSERALKLALNSLYGKMAQRAGWKPGGSIPKWHQLEWAGWITSVTRRAMWDAAKLAGDSLIAIETDAVFSTSPVPELETGDDLGEWGETVYDWITYVQSGMWFAEQNGERTEKYRGFDRGSLDYADVLRSLAMQPLPSDTDDQFGLSGCTTRFVGLGIALHTNSVWRSWVTGPRAVNIGGGGKRSHVPQVCPECRSGVSMAEGLHTLAVTTPGGRSYPHSLPWTDTPSPHLREQDLVDAWS